MNILIVGANGNIGRIVIQKLAEKNTDTIIAVVRKQEQAEALVQLGASKVVIGDLEDSLESIFAAEKPDIVIFTAGSGGKTGPDKTMTIDLWGAVKTVRSAEKYKTKHYIHVSAINSLDPDSNPDSMKPYAVAKYISDEYIRAADLDYTILQPGALEDTAETGLVEINIQKTADIRDYAITRSDVAEIIVASIGRENLYKKDLFIRNGNTPINEALKAVPSV